MSNMNNMNLLLFRLYESIFSRLHIARGALVCFLFFSLSLVNRWKWR